MKYDAITNNEFVKNIEKYFDNVENKIIYDKRNVIKIVKYNNADYVVKLFKVPHLLNKIVYRFFRSSKAKRSFLNSKRLEELKINVATPIGYIEYYKNIFFDKSYFISRYIDYDFELRSLIKDIDFPNRTQILKEFAKFCYELHEKSVYHIDFSPGNILVKKILKKYKFYLIDLNRMKFIKFNDSLRAKSLSKLAFDDGSYNEILNEYCKFHSTNKKELKEKLNKAISKHKRYIRRKQLLK